MSAFPFVTCICPTYNRRRFLPYLLHIFDYQDWPKDKKEFIILDDSPTSNQDIIDQYKKDNNIKYIYSAERINLGKKRNMLNKMAKGEYIICFDDDDYYPPCRIKKAVNTMRGSKITLSGSSQLYIYFTSIDKIYSFGPYMKNHCTNGTMAYHKSFIKDHSYDDEATKAEEKYFLKDYSAPIVQLNPNDVMLCICHDSNTIDKRKIMNTGKELSMKLKQFVKDKKLFEFYQQLHNETKDMAPLELPPMTYLDEGQFDFDAVENGYLLIQKEKIEEMLVDSEKKKLPPPVINRFNRIIKKLEKGELVEFNPEINNKQLIIDDVIKGDVKVSKDYIKVMIERLEKDKNSPPVLLMIFNKIKELQDNNVIDSCPITPMNQYAGVSFDNNNLIENFENTINKMLNKEN